MKDIVFARTRWKYDSYTDFWRLVELAEFPTCWIDEIDLTRDVLYVTTPMNGETRPSVAAARERAGAARKARVAWWNLERPDVASGAPLGKVVSEALAWVDEAWVSDRHYRSLDQRQRHVVLASDSRLRDGPPLPRRYDACHMSYVWGRRAMVLDAVGKAGIRMAPNGWGKERDEILSSSAAMLNVHQTPALIGEPLRFALAAAYALPMVSEELADPWPLAAGRDFVSARWAGLPEALAAAIADPALPEIGRALHQRLCVDRTFRSAVEEALA